MWFGNPLKKTINALLAPGKGILAADETSETIGKRLEPYGIANTPEHRRDYREMFFTTPQIADYISGVIMFDETIHETTAVGIPFPELLTERGILIGIKVDQGKIPYAGGGVGDQVTQGLGGLTGRLEKYYALGARFAKWRAVFTISPTTPSEACIQTNADALAEYALRCQALKIVPIVEPEVVMDGAHTIEQTYMVTKKVLTIVFATLIKKGVVLSGMLLKPNMILSGELSGQTASPAEVADYTLRCLKETVPSAVPGIVFLSGGQSETEACLNLQVITADCKKCPWQLSFSYGRALQNTALQVWHGNSKNVPVGQQAFLHRAMLVSAARQGMYTSALE